MCAMLQLSALSCLPHLPYLGRTTPLLAGTWHEPRPQEKVDFFVSEQSCGSSQIPNALLKSEFIMGLKKIFFSDKGQN